MEKPEPDAVPYFASNSGGLDRRGHGCGARGVESARACAQVRGCACDCRSSPGCGCGYGCGASGVESASARAHVSGCAHVRGCVHVRGCARDCRSSLGCDWGWGCDGQRVDSPHERWNWGAAHELAEIASKWWVAARRVCAQSGGVLGVRLHHKQQEKT
jgi:hypothetical protein